MKTETIPEIILKIKSTRLQPIDFTLAKNPIDFIMYQKNKVIEK